MNFLSHEARVPFEQGNAHTFASYVKMDFFFSFLKLFLERGALMQTLKKLNA